VIFNGSDVHHIPNPVDLSVYHPLPKSKARAAFGLPQDRRLVLFGALYATSDRRKGFHHLEKALISLRSLVGADFCDLVVMGATRRVPEQIEGFRVHSLGRLEGDTSIALGHNVADVFVLPSETDNLPNVIKEATSCGVPCVGFNIGGMPDMVAHLGTGFLARPYEAGEIAAGIRWVLDQEPHALSTRVRKRAVDMHSTTRCVEQYLDIYRPLLAPQVNRLDTKTAF
jgi:glycosyltransferase involved in cell wall biosynthesis